MNADIEMLLKVTDRFDIGYRPVVMSHRPVEFHDKVIIDRSLYHIDRSIF